MVSYVLYIGPRMTAKRPLLSVILISSLANVQCARDSRLIAPSPPRLGVEVEIELLENISSETLHAGQSVSFRLVRPLERSGVTLLAAGTPVTGRVRSVQASAEWGKRGGFDLALDPLRLADGKPLPVDFARPRRRSETAERAGDYEINALAYTLYFPLIPLGLVMAARKGKPYNIRAGERYLVYTAGSLPTEPPQR